MSITARTVAPVALAACVALVACSGADQSGGDAGAITAGLADLPMSAVDSARSEGDRLRVHVVDVASAARAVGSPAPGPGRGPDEVIDWLFGLTFSDTTDPGGVFTVALPESPALWDPRTDVDAVRDLVGLDMGAVTTISSVDDPLRGITVVRGPHEPADGLTDLGGGVLSLGDGEDNSLGEPDAVRRLGRPWRAGAGDEVMAVSLSTSLVEDWLDVSDGKADSVADDDEFAVVAASLDAAGAISATFVGGPFSAASNPPPLDLSAEGPPRGDERTVVIEEDFDLVGVGSALIDGEPRYVVAYLFDDVEDAERALDQVEMAWTDAVSFVTGEPVSRLARLESIQADGSVVTVTLVDDRGVGVASVLAPLVRSDVMFLHR